MTTTIALIKDIARLLEKNHWQLVTAESCTGGLIAANLTDLPGSSSWFDRGFVTYSNAAKLQMLSISPQLISQHGAVSEEVAAAMALGALQHSAGHIAVAVTGIAGPGGGTKEKPVGTVCFAWKTCENQPQTARKQLAGDRHAVRMAACRVALVGVLEMLNR